jgi:hypothetical protein
MPSIFTLTGSGEPAARKAKGLGQDNCKCVFNPRTKRSVLLCKVVKGTGKGKTRSGWAFKGKC